MSTETTGTLITPNFTEVQDQVGEGVYKVRIVDSKHDSWTSKKDGRITNVIAWTLETFNEAAEKNNGRKIFHRTPIEGPGAFRLQQFYQAAMGEPCSSSFDRTMLHGRELEVTYGPQKDKPEYGEVKSCRPITHS